MNYLSTSLSGDAYNPRATLRGAQKSKNDFGLFKSANPNPVLDIPSASLKPYGSFSHFNGGGAGGRRKSRRAQEAEEGGPGPPPPGEKPRPESLGLRT